MPIFDFECKKCTKIVEKIVPSSTAQVDCECGERMDKKAFTSAPSFRLKGNGWYETDFKNKK